MHHRLHQEWRTLAEVPSRRLSGTLDKLAISNKRLRASEIPEAHGRKSELIASICEALHGDQYLSGTGGLAYLQPDEFDRIGCEIQIQSWTTFSYPQIYDETGFSSELSALDVCERSRFSENYCRSGVGGAVQPMSQIDAYSAYAIRSEYFLHAIDLAPIWTSETGTQFGLNGPHLSPLHDNGQEIKQRFSIAPGSEVFSFPIATQAVKGAAQ